MDINVGFVIKNIIQYEPLLFIIMFKSFEKILNKELRKQNEAIEKFVTEKQMLQNHLIELKHSRNYRS